MSFIYNLAASWIDASITYNGIYINVSDGNNGPVIAAAASRIFRLDDNALSVFDVDASGKVFVGGKLGIGTQAPSFKLELTGSASLSDRKIGINNNQVVYLPDQALFLGSFFVGSGGNNLSNLGIDQGAFNTGVGLLALSNVSTAFNNVGVGYRALFTVTTGNTNTAVGTDSLRFNTTSLNCAAFGGGALENHVTGDSNAGIASYALFSHVTGIENTCVGVKAGYFIPSGNYNTILGMSAMYNAGAVDYNVAIGHSALFNTTGSNNTGVGVNSLYNNLAGTGGVAIGYLAGFNATTGIQNTFVGYNTGLGITTGSYNTILGAAVTGLAAGLANNIILSDGQGNIRIQVNNTGGVKFPTYGAGTATFDASGNITSVSDERLKIIHGKFEKGLVVLKNINPIVHSWNKKSQLEMNHRYVGFSAQNVKSIFPEIVLENSEGYLSFQDRGLLALVVNSIKELDNRLSDMEMIV